MLRSVWHQMTWCSGNAFFTSDIAKRGVHCDLCHTVKETRFLRRPPRAQNASIIVDPGPVKRGPYKDSKSPFHETAYSELHTSQYSAPTAITYFIGEQFHIERTYDEWKYSVYARTASSVRIAHDAGGKGD